uniref:Uncharacterized protein n=1 Tax=Arundo donax TaxID=35708 RepID=A0A0A9FW39_ARUDO
MQNVHSYPAPGGATWHGRRSRLGALVGPTTMNLGQLPRTTTCWSSRRCTRLASALLKLAPTLCTQQGKTTSGGENKSGKKKKGNSVQPPVAARRTTAWWSSTRGKTSVRLSSVAAHLISEPAVW